MLNQQKETDLTRPFQDIAAAWGWLRYGSLREPSLRQPQADSHELSEFTAGTLHQLDSPTCRVRLKVRLVNLRTSDDVRHFPKIVRLGRWEAIEMQ